MDPSMCDVYAAMLREAGIDISSAELNADVTAPSHLLSPPPSPRREEPPQQLPSFVHLQQLVQDPRHVPYKRASHFATHLAQLTGHAWHEDLLAVERRLKKARVKVTDEMAYFRVRRLLKRWGYGSREYRCIFGILRHMGGAVLRLSYPQETALRQDFDRLSAAFDSAKPMHGRKNFLSYYLVVQLLLDKYKIRCHYKLPSIKDTNKFKALMAAYIAVNPNMSVASSARQ